MAKEIVGTYSRESALFCLGSLSYHNLRRSFPAFTAYLRNKGRHLFCYEPPAGSIADLARSGAALEIILWVRLFAAGL